MDKDALRFVALQHPDTPQSILPLYIDSSKSSNEIGFTRDYRLAGRPAANTRISVALAHGVMSAFIVATDNIEKGEEIVTRNQLVYERFLEMHRQ